MNEVRCKLVKLNNYWVWNNKHYQRYERKHRIFTRWQLYSLHLSIEIAILPKSFSTGVWMGVYFLECSKPQRLCQSLRTKLTRPIKSSPSINFTSHIKNIRTRSDFQIIWKKTKSLVNNVNSTSHRYWYRYWHRYWKK